VVALGLLVGPLESAMVTPEFTGPETLPEIVQFELQLTAEAVRVKDCVAFDPTPLLAVMVMVVTDAPAGVPLIVAVPFPLSTKVIGLGSEPVVMDSAGVGLPVVVTVKLPFTPTVKVVLLALVIIGAACTVMVTVDVVLLPAALVTVRV
jgi:hypothetical protein